MASLTGLPVPEALKVVPDPLVRVAVQVKTVLVMLLDRMILVLSPEQIAWVREVGFTVTVMTWLRVTMIVFVLVHPVAGLVSTRV
jgi:hypothetical protein